MYTICCDIARGVTSQSKTLNRVGWRSPQQIGCTHFSLGLSKDEEEDFVRRRVVDEVKSLSRSLQSEECAEQRNCQ